MFDRKKILKFVKMDEISSGILLMFGSVRFSLVQNFSPQNNLYLLNMIDKAKEVRNKYYLFSQKNSSGL